jgi:hypothetical protein
MSRKKGTPNIRPDDKSMIERLADEARYSGKSVEEVAAKIYEVFNKFERRNIPDMDTIKKKVREVWKDPDPMERPWSTISLSKRPIPPEALPIVLRVWAMSIKEKRPLTIRQAQWVAQLQHVFKDRIEDLWIAASASAHREKILDKKKDYPETREEILWYWIEDAYFYDNIGGSTAITELLQKEFGNSWEKNRGNDIDEEVTLSEQRVHVDQVAADALRDRNIDVRKDNTISPEVAAQLNKEANK